MDQRIVRTLTNTDVSSKTTHGGEPPITDKNVLSQIEGVFGGLNVYQEFIDVETKEKHSMRITDYKVTSTPHRIGSIKKFRTKKELQVGDQIIWEKVDYTPPLYLIGYMKKAQSVSISAHGDKTGDFSPNRFNALIQIAISSGYAVKKTVNEYLVQGKYQKVKGQYTLILNSTSNMTIEFDNKLIPLKGSSVYDFIFGKKGAELVICDLWQYKKEKSILLDQYLAEEYEKEDINIERSIRSDELTQVNTPYVPHAEKKEKLITISKGKTKYPRNKNTSVKALIRANNQCEYNLKHKSFYRKNSLIKYMEPHHLIPLQYHDMFDWSLDVEANIVSLCSECHNQVHYGDGKQILTKLWYDRKNELKAANIDKLSTGEQLTLKKLLEFYGLK